MSKITPAQVDYIEADQRLTTTRHDMEVAQAQHKTALRYWREAQARMSEVEQDEVDAALRALNEPETRAQA